MNNTDSVEQKISSRTRYLLVSQINDLNVFGGELNKVFADGIDAFGAYLVGSALTTPNYRDVDIRHIVTDGSYATLESVLDIGVFNHLISLWGQKLTGLPIDYQVQPQSSPDNKNPKHPITMMEGYVNGKSMLPR